MLVEIDADKIDWEQLRHQKMALLERRDALEDSLKVGFIVDFFRKESAALTGIIHFLDYVQDNAVAQGVSHEEVFGDYEVDRESRLEVLER